MVQPRHDDFQPGIAVKADPRGQDGFILLAVLFMLLLLVLTLTIAAPKVATQLRRDKETETIHRGMQYAQAIRMYYRKYGSYPTTIDQLVKTGSGNERFLRKRYLDPMTGKDDWRLIHLGEALTMNNGTPGQPGTQTGGAAGASSIGTNGTSSQSGLGSSGTGSSGFGSSNSFGSSSSPSGSGNSGSSGFSLGNSGSSSSGSSGFSLGNSGSGSSGPSGFSLGTSGSGGSPGSTTSAPGTPSGTNGTGSSSFGNFGQNLGGGPIVGVGLPNPKASLKVFRKQTHYNQWEFVYDPSQDIGGAMGQTSTGVLQQPGASNGTNGINGTTPGFGGTSGFGASPGTATSGSSGTGSTGSGSTGTQQPTTPATEMDSPMQ